MDLNSEVLLLYLMRVSLDCVVRQSGIFLDEGQWLVSMTIANSFQILLKCCQKTERNWWI